jgi:hypothetical protein
MVVGVVLDVIDILGDPSLQIVFHNYLPLVQRVWHDISVPVAGYIISCNRSGRSRRNYGRLQSVTHVHRIDVAHFEGWYLRQIPQILIHVFDRHSLVTC